LGIIANDEQEAVEFLDTRALMSFIHHLSGANPEDYEFSTGGQTSFSSLEIVQNILAQRNDTKAINLPT